MDYFSYYFNLITMQYDAPQINKSCPMVTDELSKLIQNEDYRFYFLLSQLQNYKITDNLEKISKESFITPYDMVKKSLASLYFDQHFCKDVERIKLYKHAMEILLARKNINNEYISIYNDTIVMRISPYYFSCELQKMLNSMNIEVVINDGNIISLGNNLPNIVETYLINCTTDKQKVIIDLSNASLCDDDLHYLYDLLKNIKYDFTLCLHDNPNLNVKLNRKSEDKFIEILKLKKLQYITLYNTGISSESHIYFLNNLYNNKDKDKTCAKMIILDESAINNSIILSKYLDMATKIISNTHREYYKELKSILISCDNRKDIPGYNYCLI